MSCRNLPLGLLLALALGSAGCGKFRQISACRGVVREVNSAMDELDALAKARPLDEPRLAKRYATLAKALEPRAQGKTPFAQAVHEYVLVLHATDTSLRNHASALKLPAGRVGDPRRELERLVKREHAAVARIDVECER
jgi:hypothetical protein